MRIQNGLFLGGGMECLGELVLHGAWVGGPLSLDGAKLRNQSGVALEATSITVEGAVIMTGGFEASGEVRFIAARLKEHVGCSGAEIVSETGISFNANGASIGGSLFCNEGFKATGKLDLISCTVGLNVLLHGAQLRGSNEARLALDMSNADVDGFIGLVDHWSADNPCVIDGGVLFRHASVGQLDDSPEVWGLGNAAGPSSVPLIPLDLEGLTYKSLGIHKRSLDLAFRKGWLERGSNPSSRPFSPQPYNQLAKVLEEAGHEELAREIRIERNRCLFEKVRKPEADTPWKKALLGFYWLFVGKLLVYGYRTRRAVVGLGVMWALGALIFWAGWVGEAFNPADSRVYGSWVEDVTTSDGRPTIDMTHSTILEKQRFPGPYKDLSADRLWEYPGFVSLVYSADTLLPIVDLHQEPYWEPTGWTRVYLWLHIAAGWVFTTLAVIGFTGIVRRD